MNYNNTVAVETFAFLMMSLIVADIKLVKRLTELNFF